MSESNELAVIKEIPALADLEDMEPEALQRVEHLFHIMTSQPEGFESEVQWRPEKIKLRHSITNDQLMSPDVEVGDIYAPGQRLWSKDDDGRGKPFKFVLCYAWQTRARFPDGANQPDCTSSDCVWNDHGTLKCTDCPDEPFKRGKPTNCNNSLNMIVLPLDLSGVYVVRFSKSSYKAGSNVKKLLGTAMHSWDRVFGLTTKTMSNSNFEWNVYQTTPLAEEPAEEVKLFAKYVSHAYRDIRDAQLKSIEESRSNVEEGLTAMSGMAEDLEDDEEGFDDTM